MANLIMGLWCIRVFWHQVGTKNAGLGRIRFLRLDLLPVLKTDDIIVEEVQL